jgi:hypothetical protein
MLAGNVTHNNTNEEKTFAFLGQQFFLKFFMKNLYYDDHKTILC